MAVVPQLQKAFPSLAPEDLARFAHLPVKDAKHRIQKYIAKTRDVVLAPDPTCFRLLSAEDDDQERAEGAPGPRTVVVYIRMLAMAQADWNAYFNMMEQVNAECRRCGTTTYTAVQDFAGTRAAHFFKYNARMRRMLGYNEKYYPNMIHRVYSIHTSPKVRVCLQTISVLVPPDVWARTVVDTSGAWRRELRDALSQTRIDSVGLQPSEEDDHDDVITADMLRTLV